MKKRYSSPVTEIVNVKLYGSVLDDSIVIVNNSREGSDSGLGKQNDFDLDDDGNGFMVDLWADDEDEEY